LKEKSNLIKRRFVTALRSVGTCQNKTKDVESTSPPKEKTTSPPKEKTDVDSTSFVLF